MQDALTATAAEEDVVPASEYRALPNANTRYDKWPDRTLDHIKIHKRNRLRFSEMGLPSSAAFGEISVGCMERFPPIIVNQRSGARHLTRPTDDSSAIS